MNVINLNHICKIVYVKSEKTEYFVFDEKSKNIWEWFLNLFRKDKKKETCIKYRILGLRRYTENLSVEEFEKEYGKEYKYNPITKIFFEKPHIVLWYSGYGHGKEIKYFDTEKETKEYFAKLREYAKQFNIPFIDFHMEK